MRGTCFSPTNHLRQVRRLEEREGRRMKISIRLKMFFSDVRIAYTGRFPLTLNPASRDVSFVEGWTCSPIDFYQQVPPYVDPVPQNINQYRPLITQ